MIRPSSHWMPSPLRGSTHWILGIALIQALIPLGLDAVSALLQEEVTRLAGPRYQRKEADQAHRRWGGQPGSVYLADQKLPIQVPRVA